MNIVNVKWEQVIGNKCGIYFSYKVISNKQYLSQESYHIKVFDNDKLMWDSGIVKTKKTYDILYEGTALEDYKIYNYKISLKLDDEIIEKEGIFETKCFMKKLKADWINIDNGNYSYLVKFKSMSGFEKAYLYLSANGITDVEVNGSLVTTKIENVASDSGINSYDISSLLRKGENEFNIFYKQVNDEEPSVKYEIHMLNNYGRKKIIKSKNDNKKEYTVYKYKFINVGEICDFQKQQMYSEIIYDCGKVVFGKPILKTEEENKARIICSETLDFKNSIIYNLSEKNQLKYSKFRYFKILNNYTNIEKIAVEEYRVYFKNRLNFETSNYFINNIFKEYMNFLDIEFSERIYKSFNFSLNDLIDFVKYLEFKQIDRKVDSYNILKLIDKNEVLILQKKTPLTGQFLFVDLIRYLYKVTLDKSILYDNFKLLKKIVSGVKVKRFSYPVVEIPIYYDYLSIMLEISEIINDKISYQEFYEKRNCICNYFINKEVADNKLRTESIAAYAFVINSEITKLADNNYEKIFIEFITKRLIENNYIEEEFLDCFPIVFDALVRYNEYDLINKLLIKYYEYFSGDLSVNIMLQFLNFIKKSVLGFKEYFEEECNHIIINPKLEKIVNIVKCACSMNDGILSYSYQNNTEKINYSLDIPFNVTLTVLMLNGRLHYFKSGKYYI